MASNGRPLTGRKVLLIAVASFAVVIAANLAMMFATTGTFPGLVVENSYVASQKWAAKTEAQRALGWHAAAEYADGTLVVTMTGNDGAAVRGLSVTAVIGRPASTREDRRFELAEGAAGYSVPLNLAPGVWRVAIAGSDGEGRSYEAEAKLYVKTPS